MGHIASQIAEEIVPVLVGAVLTLLVTQRLKRAGEKRLLYAEAYKTVLAWQEMLYRVRRRAPGVEVERRLVDKFHDLQEQLNYFEGIMSTESKSLGRSYKKFIIEVKKANVKQIQIAWEGKIRRPKDGTPKNEEHPNINKFAQTFLDDSRLWLKWWQLPKLLVWKRNRNSCE